MYFLSIFFVSVFSASLLLLFIVVYVLKSSFNNQPPNTNTRSLTYQEQTTNFLLSRHKDIQIHQVINKTTTAVKQVLVPKTQKVICFDLISGFGNQMLMFASLYATAKRKGMKLVLSHYQQLQAAFKIDEAIETNWDVCKNATVIQEQPPCCGVANNIYNISNQKTVLVKGYLQSYKYFDSYKDDIRKYLTFRSSVQKKAETKLQNYLSKRYAGMDVSKRTLIGVHIRRGNFLLQSFINKGYLIATKEYLYKAQKIMQSKYSNITYIVCSNDVEWAKDVFKHQHDAIVVSMGPQEVDLALLSLMDHMIMTVGTYGFWASWFVNGTTIYCKDFAKPGSLFASYYGNETFPASWIGLN
ncbi:hypothetical protein SNE40_021475 [Patella caerulea]|uniref:L-Fucosyltransferase n=1 Tax=Patella caerulea TaxID=87958 RepID=A0AAN8IZ46_PATCE